MSNVKSVEDKMKDSMQNFANEAYARFAEKSDVSALAQRMSNYENGTVNAHAENGIVKFSA